jgi:hypothetical protein
MVQNCPKMSKWFKMVKDRPIWSDMVQTGPKCLIWSNIVQKRSKWCKTSSSSRNCPKRPNIVQIHPKFLLKTTAVGSTAVGVTAVRNNLKFWTIINIKSTIIIWWSLLLVKW